jgi:hypothetical protein
VAAVVRTNRFSLPRSNFHALTNGRNACPFITRCHDLLTLSPRFLLLFCCCFLPHSALTSKSHTETQPHRSHRDVLQRGHPVLDLPRLCRPGRRLRRIYRLRTGLPPASPQELGNCRYRRCLQRGKVPGRPGPGRRRKALHRRGLRRRIHDPGRPRLSRRLPGGVLAVRGRRSHPPGPGHAQVRVPVPRRPRRALSRR